MNKPGPAASRSARAMAMLIDITTLAFLYGGGFFMVSLLSPLLFGGQPPLLFFLLQSPVSLLISITLPFTYFTLLHSVAGQTIGKHCLGLQVVQHNGEPLSLSASSLRTLGYLVHISVYGFSYAWSIVTDYQEMWHDSVTGTTVVEVR